MTSKDSPMTHNTFPLTLLYDGACPLCMLEMRELMARNTAQLLRFEDISAPGFDATPYGASLAAMNGLIHAQRADGSLVVGVEVFRLAYGAVGLRALVAPTAWPVLKPVVDALYAFFARHRMLLSRWFSPAALWLSARRAAKRSAACKEGACDVSSGRGSS